MSTCTARPTYGVAEFVALVVAMLRPWLDAIRTEFAAAPAKPTEAPKPEALLHGPQAVAEVPTAAPAVEQLLGEQVLGEQVLGEQVLGEQVPALDVSGLFVRRGEGHKVRYLPWDGVEGGHLYRRRQQPNGKATYKQVPPATYQHGQRRRVHP